MAMHKPPHPGEFILDVCLEPTGIRGRQLAETLDVAASTLSRILKGSGRVTPEMALRRAQARGRSAERWLVVQNNHDLWKKAQRLGPGLSGEQNQLHGLRGG